MAKIKSMCVYCGAQPGSNPAFRNAAVELAKMLARKDITLVFGGGMDGLMGVTARAAREAGAHVTGIMPHFLSHLAETACTEIIFTDNMHDRKQAMFDKANAFIALPGGIGTLEELAEQMKWIQLGKHAKPIFLLNVSDYWTPLLDLFKHMRDNDFLTNDVASMLRVCSSVGEIEAIIDRG